MQLSFSEPPLLNKPVNLTATFTLLPDYHAPIDATAQIILPEGLEKISGDLEQTMELSPGQSYKLDTKVRSIKTGIWRIGVSAASAKYDGVGGGSELWVTVSEHDAIVSKSAPSGPSQSPYQTNPPPRYPTSSQTPATPISNETMPNFNFEQSLKGLSGTPKQ